jgi:hypothetical protein
VVEDLLCFLLQKETVSVVVNSENSHNPKEGPVNGWRPLSRRTAINC